MNLCKTTRDADGSVRYYAGGRRISRSRMRDLKQGARLDTFQTVRRSGYTRQYCCLRGKTA